MTKYKISYKEGNTSPFSLAHFATGIPPKHESLEFDANLSTSNNAKRSVSSIRAGNEFVNYKGEAKRIKTIDGLQYLVGIVDKSKKTIDLVDADIFNMETQIRNPVFENAVDIDETSTLDENETEYQKTLKERAALVESFAGRRNKTKYSSAAMNRVDVTTLGSSLETDLSSHLDSTLQKNGAESIIDSQSQNESNILPKRDVKADAVEDVYKIDDIIPVTIMNELKQASKVLSLAKKSDIDSWNKLPKPLYNRFVLEQLSNMLGLNPALKSQKSRLLIFVHYLMSMERMKGGRKKKDIGSYLQKLVPSDITRNYLLSEFTQMTYDDESKKNIYTITDDLGDKIVAHVVILSLIINNFAFNIETFLQQYNKRVFKIKNVVKSTGARISEKSKMATLKLPIPIVSNGKRAKRS